MEPAPAPALRRAMWALTTKLAGTPSHQLPFESFTVPEGGDALQRTGYLRSVSDGTYGLTTQGVEWVQKHGAAERRPLEAQYLVFDDFREGLQENPESTIHYTVGPEDCADLNLTFKEVVQALAALASADLLESKASNSGKSNTYFLTPKGKQRCYRPDLLLGDLEPQPALAQSVHTYNTTNVHQGFAIVGTVGNVTLDIGDISYGQAVPSDHREEITRLLTELGKEAEAVEDCHDRALAVNNVQCIAVELTRPQPRQDRLTLYISAITAVAPHVGGWVKGLKELLKSMNLL